MRFCSDSEALPYLPAIRDAFGPNAMHGQIVKTYSVTHIAARP
jgi:hypothetical protein